MKKVCEEYPNISLIATTVRTVHSASSNSLRAVCFEKGRDGLLKTGLFERLDVLDRIGSGDSFASGLLFSLMNGDDTEYALEVALAHAALAMTTPGDTSAASKNEVFDIVNKKSAKVVR